jgi:hypothetical protein
MRKSSKEFLGILLGVLICVFVVGVFVYATTTVGNNISVGGVISINGSGTATELSILGTASVSQDLWASGSFQFAGGEGTATASYSRLGSGTTGHLLSNANDLLITGSVEVDGTAYFDGTVSLSDSSTLYTTNIIGVRDTGLYLRIGDEALTSHSLAADDDMLVTGKLEVDGTAFFDGLVSVSDANGMQIGGGATITIVAASPSCTGCVVGSLFIDTTNATIHMCDAANTCTLIQKD